MRHSVRPFQSHAIPQTLNAIQFIYWNFQSINLSNIIFCSIAYGTMILWWSYVFSLRWIYIFNYVIMVGMSVCRDANYHHFLLPIWRFFHAVAVAVAFYHYCLSHSVLYGAKCVAKHLSVLNGYFIFTAKFNLLNDQSHSRTVKESRVRSVFSKPLDCVLQCDIRKNTYQNHVLLNKVLIEFGMWQAIWRAFWFMRMHARVNTLYLTDLIALYCEYMLSRVMLEKKRVNKRSMKINISNRNL